VSTNIVHRRPRRHGDGNPYPGIDPATALTILNLAIGGSPGAEQVREAAENVAAALEVTPAQAARYLESLVHAWRALKESGVAV
jgi:hypothetical protein